MKFPDSGLQVRHATLWLMLAVLLVYAQVSTHQFNNYDDNGYLTANPHVTGGLTARGIEWAFTGNILGMWHPLTGLSHLVDWTVFGNWAPGHLAVNVAWHALNVLLFHALLRRLTGANWPSFVVALLFAVHPLNVESVAWASQRKTVLSGFFFLLTLFAWEGYLRRKTISRYLIAVAAYAAGLMSKPSLLLLPCLLVLLDFWPRPRWQWRTGVWPGLILEKLPFVLLSAVSALFVFHPPGGAFAGGANQTGFTAEHWARALANTVVYLRRVVWPVDLAALYPQRSGVTWPELVAATLVLVGLSLLAWRRGRAACVGWIWFVVMLFPMSGIIPIGPHEQADRYAYLPLLGLLLGLAGGLPAIAWQSRVFHAGALCLVVAFGLQAARQVGYWRDALSLWTRATELYPPSLVQQLNYGNALAAAGRDEEARSCFEIVARLRPQDPQAFINLAALAARRGDHAQIIALLRQALAAAPDHARAHADLGSALHDVGYVDEAHQHLTAALALDPTLVEAHINLGVLQAQQGDLSAAEKSFSRATELQPDNLDAWRDLELVRRQRAAASRPAP